MTIDPLALDLGGTMKQVLTVPDASGLTPLELPVGLARQEGDNARPSPSQDAISRFQAAMGGPLQNPLLGLVNRLATVDSPEGRDSPVVPADVAFPVSDTIEVTGNGERATGNVSLPVSDTPLVSGTPANLPSAPTGVTLPVSDTPANPPSALSVSDAPLVSGTPPVSGTPANPPSVPTGVSPLVSGTPANPTSVPTGVTLSVSDTIEGQGNGSTVQRFNSSTNQRTNEPTNKRINELTVNGEQGTVINRQTVKLSNRQTAKPLPKTNEPEPLQAAPVVVPREALPAEVTPLAAAGAVSLEIDPASASARTQELVDAAAAVADTILVTPSLVQGEGEVTIRLRPTVLDGSEIRLEAKGEAITVAITPASVEVQRLAEQSQARFTAELAERIPSFQIAVVINPRQVTSRRDLRDETA